MPPGRLVFLQCDAICPTCDGPVWLPLHSWLGGVPASRAMCCSHVFCTYNGPVYAYRAGMTGGFCGPEVGNTFTKVYCPMRERERLDDFQGGGIACRVCKRVMDFGVGLMAPQICCGMAYVPTQRQIDVVIYDKLTAEECAMYGDMDDAQVHETPPQPLVIPAEEDGEPEPEDEEAPDETEVESLLVSDEEIAARTAARLEQLRSRGRR